MQLRRLLLQPLRAAAPLRLAGRNFVPPLRALPAPLRSLSTTTAANPLLPGAPIPPPEAPPPDALEAGGPPEYLAGERTQRLHAVAHFRNLPVSPKKLRLVANLTRGLYVREAMAQMEFCRKNIAVMVKNCIDNACANARWGHGLDVKRLKVSYVSVGKGSYVKGIDYKSKGRAGIKNSYFSHLRIEVTEVSQKEIEATKGYGRWRRAEQLLAIPWEERVKELPRYVRPEGYEPGEPQPHKWHHRNVGPAIPDQQHEFRGSQIAKPRRERLGRAHDYYHNREP